MADDSRHFSDAEVQACIEKHDDPDHPDSLDVAEARTYLAEMQRDAEEHWHTYLDAIEDEFMEVVADEGEIVVLADHGGGEIKELQNAIGVPEDDTRVVLSAIHHETASRYTDYDWGTSDPLVIRKPDGDGGQRYVEAVVNHLMRSGLSPGQAWAVYGVHVAGHSRNQWAKRCGYSDHSAVSEPLRKAKEHAGHLGVFSP